jgi:hypothetical protein
VSPLVPAVRPIIIPTTCSVVFRGDDVDEFGGLHGFTCTSLLLKPTGDPDPLILKQQSSVDPAVLFFYVDDTAVSVGSLVDVGIHIEAVVFEGFPDVFDIGLHGISLYILTICLLNKKSPVARGSAGSSRGPT